MYTTHLSTTPWGVSALASDGDLPVETFWDPFERLTGLGVGLFGVALNKPLNL